MAPLVALLDRSIARLAEYAAQALNVLSTDSDIRRQINALDAASSLRALLNHSDYTLASEAAATLEILGH